MCHLFIDLSSYISYPQPLPFAYRALTGSCGLFKPVGRGDSVPRRRRWDLGRGQLSGVQNLRVYAFSKSRVISTFAYANTPRG